MFYRNKKIEDTIAGVVGRRVAIGIYIIFAGVVVLVEEVMISYQHYRQTEKLLKLKTVKLQKVYKLGPFEQKISSYSLDTMTPFQHLQTEEQESYTQYYESTYTNRAWNLQIKMARESATQLCLQNALVVYEYFYQPLHDMNYQQWPHPTAVWCLVLALRLLSIFLSAYSTFKPIIENLNLREYKRVQRPPTVTSYVIKVLQTFLHIIFVTSVTYL